jgi:hypothetical protein
VYDYLRLELDEGAKVGTIKASPTGGTVVP